MELFNFSRPTDFVSSDRTLLFRVGSPLAVSPVRHVDVLLTVGAGEVLDDGALLLAVAGALGAVEVAGSGVFLQALQTVLDSHPG
jgi:hypothetical protein